jgi:hypothetical protein
LNSHSSFKEDASVNTAEWPPPAASLLTSPTHLDHRKEHNTSHNMLMNFRNQSSYLLHTQKRELEIGEIPINWRGVPSISRFLISRLTITVIAPSIYTAIFHRYKCVGMTTSNKPYT